MEEPPDDSLPCQYRAKAAFEKRQATGQDLTCQDTFDFYADDVHSAIYEGETGEARSQTTNGRNENGVYVEDPSAQNYVVAISFFCFRALRKATYPYGQMCYF